VLVFFSPIIFTSNNYFLGDLYTQFFPWKYFLQKSVQAGVMPFWNPLVYSGVPFAADIQKGVFYPLSIFFIIFNYSLAFKTYIITHFLLMGFSTYALMRRFSFSKPASIAGVIVFLFNTFTLSKISYLNVLGSYALMPLILLSFLNFLSKKEVPYFVIFLLTYTLSLLAGHPPTLFYTTILIVLFWFYENSFSFKIFSIRKILKPVYFLIISFAAIFALSMPQSGIFYELLNLSSRGSSYEYSAASAASMSFMNLWGFIMPAGINGFSVDHLKDWTLYATGIMNYFSITALFLVFLSFFYPKSRLYKFSLGLLVFSIIMALGKNTPVHSWVFTFLPFFSQLRNPGFAMTLFVVPCSVIIASTIDHIISFSTTHVPFINRFSYTAGFSKKVYRFFSYALAASVVVLLLVYFNRTTVMKNYNLSPETESNFMTGLFGFIAIFGANFLLFFLKEKDKISKLFYVSVIGFLIFFELIYFVSGINPYMTDGIYNLSGQKSETINIIGSSNYKFLHTETAAANPVMQDTDLLMSQLELISRVPSNTGILYGLKDAGGYNPVEPKSYAAYLKDVIKDDNVLDYDKLNLLNVKYLISLSDITNPGLEKIYDKKIKIYKNLHALPLFYTSVYKDTLDLVVGQYAYSLNNEFDFGMYKVDVSIEKPGYFIFSNNFYPGWRAYIDNKSAVIERCFGIFMGIFVTPGVHDVTFKYTPTNLKFYFILFFTAILLFIFFAAAWLLSQNRSLRS
jgi:hypothetical protein